MIHAHCTSVIHAHGTSVVHACCTSMTCSFALFTLSCILPCASHQFYVCAVRPVSAYITLSWSTAMLSWFLVTLPSMESRSLSATSRSLTATSRSLVAASRSLLASARRASSALIFSYKPRSSALDDTTRILQTSAYVTSPQTPRSLNQIKSS